MNTVTKSSPNFNLHATLLLRQRCPRAGCRGNIFSDFDISTNTIDLCCTHCGRRWPYAHQQRARLVKARTSDALWRSISQPAKKGAAS